VSVTPDTCCLPPSAPWLTWVSDTEALAHERNFDPFASDGWKLLHRKHSLLSPARTAIRICTGQNRPFSRSVVPIAVDGMLAGFFAKGKLLSQSNLRCFGLRETSVHPPFSMQEIAQKPSCLSSKMYLSPVPSTKPEPAADGRRLVSIPVVGGLHHRYIRVAA
jgi:hypothetical protein